MNPTEPSRPQFVVCITNAEYPASLELYKIYRVLPDEEAAGDGNIRVIAAALSESLYRKTADVN